MSATTVLDERLSDAEQEKRAVYVCYLSASALSDVELASIALPIALGRRVPETVRGYAPALSRMLISGDGTYHELAKAGILAAMKQRSSAVKP